jgi:putative heme-binding domain-containing protein
MPDEHGYVVATAMTSLTPENVARVVEAVLRESEGGGAREAVIASLLGQAIAMGDATVHDSIVQLAAGSPAWRRLLAAAVDELEKMPDGYRGLSAVAQQHLEARADEARHMVADASAEEDVRVEAVRLLGRDPERQTEDYSLLASVLVPQSPVDLQQAVVWHLATRSATGVADVLLTGWASHSPQLREQVLGVLATREAWRHALRDRVQEGVVRAAEVPAPVRQRLLEGGNDAEDWQRLFAEMSAGTNLQSKAGVSEQVRAALDLSGEPSQGEASFRRLCLSCHALGDEGHAVGPQLASITDKSPAALLTSVLDPNAAVDANYLNYVLLTTDGRQLDGRLVSETASSITLLASGGVRHAVLRSEIDVLQASMQSVMPEGLGRDLSPQNLADLIAFVRDAFASPTVER